MSAAHPDRADFVDWLSPMLVKELRQGLRTRVFVLTFILVQVLMLLNVTLSLASASKNLATSASGVVFWLMIGLPVMFVLPLSGLSAVSSEMKANTLELIFLTRLSASRILFGKWLAIVAQTALFILAVLPYVLLRYFIGGVNLTDELLGLVLMLTGSAMFTAITVGISPYQTRLTRVLIWIGIIFGLQAFVPIMLFFAYSPIVSGGGPVFDWSRVLALPVLGSSLIVLMIQIGASRIAPAASNHSAAKRLIALAQFLVAVVFSLLVSDSRQITLFAAVLCLPVFIGSVTENPRDILSIYRPWVAGGAFRRWIGRLLYAGWPSGVPFTILLLAGFSFLMSRQGLFTVSNGLAFFVSVAGALLLPVAIVRLLLPRTERALGILIGFQALSVTLAIVALIVKQIVEFPFIETLAFLPASAFVFLLSNDFPAEKAEFIQTAVLISTGLSIVGLLFAMPGAWRKIIALERRAKGGGDDGVA